MKNMLVMQEEPRWHSSAAAPAPSPIHGRKEKRGAGANADKCEQLGYQICLTSVAVDIHLYTLLAKQKQRF